MSREFLTLFPRKPVNSDAFTRFHYLRDISAVSHCFSLKTALIPVDFTPFHFSSAVVSSDL